MKEITKKIRVTNNLGLHTRPATTIVRFLQGFQSEVFFTCRDETVDARSVLNIVLLAAGKNSLITITCKGEDSEAVLEGLETLFRDHFGEKG